MYQTAAKVNGEENNENSPKNLVEHYLSFSNSITRIFDWLALYDAYLPYWLQPIFVVGMLTVYWYIFITRFVDLEKLKHTLINSDSPPPRSSSGQDVLKKK